MEGKEQAAAEGGGRSSPAAGPVSPGRRGVSVLFGAGLVLLIALYVLHFHHDTARRDAFSWMDPCQYYAFAVDCLKGARSFDSFELPSIFPFFSMPVLAVFGASIPAALWTNVLFFGLLVLSLRLLRRSLGIAAPTLFVAAAVLSSPLLFGLSRSFYSEFGLTALVAFQFALWFGTEGFRRRGAAFLYGVVFAVGLTTKMTYPLFFAGPFLVEGARLLYGKRRRELALMAAAHLLPAVLVVLVESLVFENSLSYYLSLGNTRFPLMSLIGPPEALSPGSVAFYFLHVWKTLFLFLTPFLALPLFLAVKGRIAGGGRAPPSSPPILWAWFLAPLVLLVFEPVKEPRHVAPCVTAGVLLLFQGITAVRGRRLAGVLTGGVFLLSLLQYFAAAEGAVACPYLLEGPLGLERIEEGVLAADGAAPPSSSRRGPAERLRLKFARNVVCTGFGPNEALALTWKLFPAVTYDLDLLESPGKNILDLPYETFEDLYFLSAFNTYNRRCLWPGFYRTLSRDEVLANADRIVCRGITADAAAKRFPGRKVLSAFDVAGSPVVLLSAAGPTVSYRTLYARKFLAEGKTSSPEVLRSVYYELGVTAILRGAFGDLGKVLNRCPGVFAPGRKRRNIYWCTPYALLHRIALGAFKRWRSGRDRIKNREF